MVSSTEIGIQTRTGGMTNQKKWCMCCSSSQIIWMLFKTAFPMSELLVCSTYRIAIGVNWDHAISGNGPCMTLLTTFNDYSHIIIPRHGSRFDSQSVFLFPSSPGFEPQLKSSSTRCKIVPAKKVVTVDQSITRFDSLMMFDVQIQIMLRLRPNICWFNQLPSGKLT